MFSFGVALILGISPDWTVDEWCELAEQRYIELQVAKPVELPYRMDAAIWVCVAESLWCDGGHELACAAMARAVECEPGNQELLNLEREILAERSITFDARDFVIGTPSGEEAAATEG